VRARPAVVLVGDGGTHDQMVQAARSGVQNIAEGSMASATSKKTELKLTNVARASLAGLGGRSRHPGSIAEGAWLNVTRAVRSAILRIATPDPELATHLEATVRTGTVCVHSPDPRAPMGWRVSVAPVHRG